MQKFLSTLSASQLELLTAEELKLLLAYYEQCGYDKTEKTLPKRFIMTISANVLVPSGEWKDYNTDYKRYVMLRRLVDQKIYPESCLPAPPEVSDYPLE